ncbi:MAG: metal-dependent transcriptional regulator [Candidatus Omnitrophica bacterium]|nr:metal-dependent transcriptional regulator [Candidatus Omnitrophota bacterium]
MRQASTEDYLRTMYRLYEEIEPYDRINEAGKGIRSVDIAKELKISKPSVSKMVKKLILKKYIKAKPYSNIYFTNKGLKEARRVMHNHRVIEVFLRDMLNCDLNKVHEEAHKLEHTFSEHTIRKLDKFLNNPKISPTGKEIPHDNKR